MPIKFYLPLAALPVCLVACGPSPEQIAFTSEADKLCYERADAELTSSNQSLMRDGNGNFVVVTQINGFTRGISASETYEKCMVAETGSGSLSDLGTVNFSPDEAEAWSRLTDAEKREALEVIRRGGTLSDYLAA